MAIEVSLYSVRRWIWNLFVWLSIEFDVLLAL